MMVNPSEQTLKEAVSSNAVENSPFDRADVANARRIFGPALEDARGKTTRRKPEGVKERHVSIPMKVVERLKHLTMAADVFFVDKLPFLITMSRKLLFRLGEGWHPLSPNRSACLPATMPVGKAGWLSAHGHPSMGSPR